MSEVRPRFHLAFPVPNLQDARDFFTGILGCSEGRSASRWVDFDFFGHQISAHLVTDDDPDAAVNGVDGDRVPTRHFGLILAWDDWESLPRRHGMQAGGLCHQAQGPLRRQGGRAGHHVHSWPRGKCVGIQELPRRGPDLRDMIIIGNGRVGGGLRLRADRLGSRVRCLGRGDSLDGLKPKRGRAHLGVHQRWGPLRRSSMRRPLNIDLTSSLYRMACSIPSLPERV